MIYRILCSGLNDNAFFLAAWNKANRPKVPKKQLMGAWAANVPSDWAGLSAPPITNKRSRFYFTERGWRLIGRFLADAARRDGRVVRVIRRKNPPRSSVVYKDDLQLALLPRKGTPRKTRASRRAKTPNHDV